MTIQCRTRSRYLRLLLFPFLLSAASAAAAPMESGGLYGGGDLHHAEQTEHEGQEISDIVLLGNVATSDVAILRELHLSPGLPFSAAALERDLRFLLGLGLFASVEAGLSETPAGLVITLQVVERGEISKGLIYPIGEYDETFGVTFGVAYRHRNLRGGRESLYLEKTMGRHDGFVMNFRRPWLGTLPLEHGLDLRQSAEEDEKGFRTFNKASFRFWYPLRRQRPLEHRFLASLGLGDIYQEEDETEYEDCTNHIGLGYSHDTRNSFLRPSSGVNVSGYWTMFDPGLGSSLHLQRLYLRMSGYQDLAGGWLAAAQLQVDMQRGRLLHRGVYSLGGMNVLRGYNSGELDGWSGHDSQAGPAGRNRLLAHLELRHEVMARRTFSLPFVGIFDVTSDVVFFADAGHLWRRGTPWQPQSIDAKGLGLGAGIRVYTPFGDALRLELALSDQEEWRIHLGSGISY